MDRDSGVRTLTTSAPSTDVHLQRPLALMANDTRVLFCLVEGDNTPFKVTVPTNSDVDDLKTPVLVGGIGVSQGVLAKDLALLKVGRSQQPAHGSRERLAGRLGSRQDRPSQRPSCQRGGRGS
jgi:hypothetical protein